MMAISKTIRGLGTAAALLSIGACIDLSVANVNAPDRTRALSEARAGEALISGTFPTPCNPPATLYTL